MSDGLGGVVEALAAEWRLDFRVAERVLEALGPGGSVADLVAAANADRHDVEEVLRRLEPWLRREGARYMLDGAAGEIARRRPPVDERTLAATMTEIAAELPPSVRNLDHVPAQPATMAARARYLADRYTLAGSTVLCVGDHDLTSVALALAEPDAELLVVDIDERLLAYISRVAAERALEITTAFADLRLGLPPSYAERADLVFTDPPYTPDGVALFLARGLEGLSRTGHERVAFAYAFAGRQLARGFRTQAVLHELRLVVEAVLPGFNRYLGAEAIGGSSDLYVCRPTRWTWPLVDRAPVRQPRIYTKGGAATESSTAALGPSVVDSVVAELGDVRTFVGADWPPEVLSDRPADDLGALLATPPSGRDVTVAVNLHPYFGAVLPQVLLGTARVARTVVVASSAAVQQTLTEPLRRLLNPVVDLDVRQLAGGISIVSTGCRNGQPDSETDRLAAYLVCHPATKVGNAWRDALIELADRRNATVTRNEARALIRGTGVPEQMLQLRLGELPRDALARLVSALPHTVDAFAGR